MVAQSFSESLGISGPQGVVVACGFEPRPDQTQEVQVEGLGQRDGVSVLRDLGRPVSSMSPSSAMRRRPGARGMPASVRRFAATLMGFALYASLMICVPRGPDSMRRRMPTGA